LPDTFYVKPYAGWQRGAYKNSDNRLRRLCPSENAVSMVSIKEREGWIAAEILRQRGLSTRV
jgi:IS30 family transposase